MCLSPFEPSNARRSRTTSAFCVRCKAKRDINNPQSITMKNGKKALQGSCPSCGTKMFRIGG